MNNRSTAAHDIAVSAWRKSSRSDNSTGQCVEVGAWHKSTRSANNAGQNCVEAASCNCHGIAVRDSKHLATPPLTLTPADWTALLTTVRDA